MYAHAVSSSCSCMRYQGIEFKVFMRYQGINGECKVFMRFEGIDGEFKLLSFRSLQD